MWGKFVEELLSAWTYLSLNPKEKRKLLEGEGNKEKVKLMKIGINHPFISRKTAISWPAAGMTKEKHKIWIQALQRSLRKNKECSGWLKQVLKEGRKLKLKVSIFGIPQRIKQLDIHDALSQIIDETTDCLFPIEKGKSISQTEDRHFWKVEAEKFINPEEKVKIEIEELKQKMS